MIVISGKTASGKNAVVDKMVKNYKFKTIVTYTTRPKRKGEKDGKTYHFISEDEFKTKIEEGFFAEYNSFNTEFGTWYYGSAKDDYVGSNDKTVIILTPTGVQAIKDLGYDVKSIYLYANETTIKERLVKRGDTKSEADRRVLADRVDFKGFENLADKIVYNNGKADLDEVIRKILEEDDDKPDIKARFLSK